MCVVLIKIGSILRSVMMFLTKKWQFFILKMTKVVVVDRFFLLLRTSFGWPLVIVDRWSLFRGRLRTKTDWLRFDVVAVDRWSLTQVWLCLSNLKGYLKKMLLWGFIRTSFLALEGCFPEWPLKIVNKMFVLLFLLSSDNENWTLKRQFYFDVNKLQLLI